MRDHWDLTYRGRGVKAESVRGAARGVRVVIDICGLPK